MDSVRSACTGGHWDGVARARLLVLVVCGLLGCSAGADTLVIDAVEVVDQIATGRSPLLLDVRSPEEYRSGHVPGALNIPHDQLASRLDEIAASRGESVVVYCERGGRAARAERVLHDAGFDRVGHLRGDMAAWRKAGHPTE